ncbi:MAG TPA: type I-U CRISPR-associated protein Csb2 [Gaiellaceae bacterium]|jgi:CRISPR-associated protein Csb2|nr:type I-U CRISPR-associated protein Csb2 [Gaiellaceae bacterium]
MSALVLYVRLHDGRYHGEGDWPPSPARLFQALVAGAGLGGPLGDDVRSALQWLEEQEAPTIAAPRAWRPGRGVLYYMPNNDSDSIGGDPARISKRTAKVFRPHFFDAEISFVYAWPLATDDQAARAVCSLAELVYQLGRGIDMAWAWGEILDGEALDALLTHYPGCVFRPSVGRSTLVLPAPLPGSLESVERRYRASGDRFRYGRGGRTVRVVFRQPPRPRFRRVSYESPPARRLYELRQPTPESAFAPWPLVRAPDLVVRLRDAAVARLENALPQRKAEVARVLIGRKPDGTNDGPTGARVRIVPLPSIGHPQADRDIRRVLVEVPAQCPLRADDVWWAFSGLQLFDPVTGELLGAVLTSATDESMLRWYGIADAGSWRTWRSVTPVALPPVRRPRADERARRQAHAAAAVVQALRHAGLRSSPETVRVQREPFESKGVGAESFATRTRFTRDRLWHVEVTFPEPIHGPLVIGDGRFLGLGVLRPVDRSEGVHAFAVHGGLGEGPDPGAIARALRRAVMSRVQELLGPERGLPVFFSGHERTGEPARSERSPHLAFLFDPGALGQPRLLIVAPHVLERREPTPEERCHLRNLDAALIGFQELRAGSAGRLILRSEIIDTGEDPLFAPAREWGSVTPYQVTRHAKNVGVSEALAADVRAECRRRGLPEPLVSARGARALPGRGLTGDVRLTFVSAVEGPIVLGRSRYLGGGLFAGSPV